MAKEKNNVVESLEFFELTLNVPNSQIPIAELIEYLRNTDKVFKGINQTLNEKYAIGYNFIAMEAREKSSICSLKSVSILLG